MNKWLAELTDCFVRPLIEIAYDLSPDHIVGLFDSVTKNIITALCYFTNSNRTEIKYTVYYTAILCVQWRSWDRCIPAKTTSEPLLLNSCCPIDL